MRKFSTKKRVFYLVPTHSQAERGNEEIGLSHAGIGRTYQ